MITYVAECRFKVYFIAEVEVVTHAWRNILDYVCCFPCYSFIRLFLNVDNLTIIHQIAGFCVCLLPHKIGALQGIDSRHSMPVEGQILSRVTFV